MSTEAAAVATLYKFVIGGFAGLMGIIMTLIGIVWRKNENQTKEAHDKIDTVHSKLDQEYYTKSESDERVKLMMEPMIQELRNNTDTTKGLDRTMRNVEKQLAVLGDRFGNK